MKERKLQERGLTRAERHNRMMDKIFDDFKKQCNKMAEFLKDHGVSEEEIEELKKNTGLGRNALDDKLTELGIRDEFFNREEIKESKGSKVLTEGTSNFWSMSNFPLLIFEDYDYVYDRVCDMTAEELGDDFDGEIFDTKEFEDNWEKYYNFCTLTEEEQDELQDKIFKFNDKLERMALEKEDENDEYSPEAKIEIKPGYYEAAQLYVPNEKYLEDWQIKEIEKFLKAMKKEFGLTQLSVAWHASNGETGYNKVEESTVSEDVRKEWKPNTKFSHIKDVLTKALERGKYINNEREEVLTAMDIADKGGYTAEQRQFIRDKHKEMWQKGRKTNESVGQDVTEYQKWVDYDMKKYHKISNDTMNKIKKAGLSVVKDQYGDYEVIAYRPIKESFSVIDVETGDKFGNFSDSEKATLKARQYKNLGLGNNLVIINNETEETFALQKDGTLKALGKPIKEASDSDKKLTEAKFVRRDHLAHGMYNGKMITVYGELQDTRDYRWEDVHIEEEYDQVGFGRYKWLNRPWQRFTYAEAFRDAVVAWFGIQANDKIDKAIDESSNVQQALDKFMSSIGWTKDERTDEGLKK